ncbi:MAG: hypothetical protein AB7P99_11940 [Vicinamibacterales bacterium]
MSARPVRAVVVFAIASLLAPLCVQAQSISPPAVRPAENPADPFAAIRAGRQTAAEYQGQFRYAAAVDPADPFHNWGGNLWNQTWTGEWLAAHAAGQTFAQFWNGLQGRAGQSLILASPYPYTSAEEHWRAWRAAANRGAGPASQPATPQDWSGQWGGGGAGNVLQRDYYASVSAEYKPRYVMSIQAEIEGRHWWPADSCLPNAYGGVGTFAFRYANFNGPLVHFNNPNPLYEGRYVMVGRDFLPPDESVPSYMGESIAFWDGDELVVWTRNLHPNMRGHGEAEYSGEMQMIERYYRTGDSLVVDVTRYDPVAYAAPQHSAGVFTRAAEYQVPIFNECVSTNNVHHDEKGWIADVGPGEPGYKDIFDLTPWYTNWMKAEAAKRAGQAPPAPSIMELAPRRQESGR